MMRWNEESLALFGKLQPSKSLSSTMPKQTKKNYKKGTMKQIRSLSSQLQPLILQCNLPLREVCSRDFFHQRYSNTA